MSLPGKLVALVLMGAVIAGLAVFTLGRDGSAPHQLHVVVGDATNAVVGQYIRAAGVPVGRISSIEPVDGGRSVRLGLRLSDKAWPLPTGSKLQLRWAGTANYDNRYIALTMGPAGSPPIRDGATLPAADFSSPVELDTFLSAFNPKVRGDFRSFVDNAGATLKNASPNLTRVLTKTPPTLDSASHVMTDLVADRQALDTLLRQTDAVVTTVQTSDPGVKELLTGAGQTFTAVAQRQAQLRTTLDAAPATLGHVRSTLADADTTLEKAADLTTRLSPGTTELRRIAAPLDHVLGTVVQVGPDASHTLATARGATPQLNPLLVKATAQLPQLASIGKQATDQLTCLRPYSPEIAAFFSNWGDFLSDTDGRDKYIRANVIVPTAAPTNAEPFNTGVASQLDPNFEYGNPRPPGGVADQPWYQPNCGITAANTDPFQDPESR